MFPELLPCVNGQKSEYPYIVNANDWEDSNIFESGNISHPTKSPLVLFNLQRLWHLVITASLTTFVALQMSRSGNVDHAGKNIYDCVYITRLRHFGYTARKLKSSLAEKYPD